MASIRKRIPPEMRHRRKIQQIMDYKKTYVQRIVLDVSKRYEPDIVQWLADNKPYCTAIKWLIREQIKREQAELDEG